MLTKLKKLNFDTNQKHKFWQNSKNQILTKPPQKIVTVVKVTVVTVAVETVVNKQQTTWHLDNRWYVLGAASFDSGDVLSFHASLHIPIPPEN